MVPFKDSGKLYFIVVDSQSSHSLASLSRPSAGSTLKNYPTVEHDAYIKF